MNSYYLFLLHVWVFTFSGELKGKVSTFSVENSFESHNPVEVSDLRILTIQERGGYRPTRCEKTADGPLRDKEWLFHELKRLRRRDSGCRRVEDQDPFGRGVVQVRPGQLDLLQFAQDLVPEILDGLLVAGFGGVQTELTV